MPARTRYIYDQFAARYDYAFAPWERRFLSRWRAETLAWLPARSRLLEVGAGTGLNFSHYPTGARAVASEPSGEMIMRARGKIGPADDVVCVRGRAEELPFAAHSFDAACATLVFCSVASPRRAFDELRRVVKPGGIVALLEHVRPGNFALGLLFDALSFFTVRLFGDHFNRRTALEARGAGLRVERVTARAGGAVQTIICRV